MSTIKTTHGKAGAPELPAVTDAQIAQYRAAIDIKMDAIERLVTAAQSAGYALACDEIVRQIHLTCLGLTAIGGNGNKVARSWLLELAKKIQTDLAEREALQPVREPT